MNVSCVFLECPAVSSCLSNSCLGRIMAVAQEELHSSLKRIRGECTRVKQKLEDAYDKGDRLKVIAVQREKVPSLIVLALTTVLLKPCSLS